MGNCEFCLEFSGSQAHEITFFHKIFPQEPDRILFETNNFVAFPGLGQIVEGYLLIITKNHYTSMGDLHERLYPELSWIIERTSEILKSEYKLDVMQFEHGASRYGQGGSCCIEHAHLHLAPLGVDVSPYIVRKEARKVQNYPESTRDLLEERKPYLYVNMPYDNGREELLLDASDLPSQYMRQVIARAVGKADEWDWNIFLGKKEIESCLKKLKPKFTELKRAYIDEKEPQYKEPRYEESFIDEHLRACTCEFTPSLSS